MDCARRARRYYEQEQLLRLQQILLLRDLGLGLEGFAQNYEDVREGLTAYLRDAMAAYADARLT